MEQGGNFEFENPQIKKIIDDKTQYFEDFYYQEEYGEIRERNKQIFKEKQNKRLEEFVTLLSRDTLNEKSSNDLTNLIKIKSKNGYWRTDNRLEINDIILGFKELYKGKGKKDIKKKIFVQ